MLHHIYVAVRCCSSTAEHARHVVEIFEAAYRSAQTGQVQDLTSTFIPPHGI